MPGDPLAQGAADQGRGDGRQADPDHVELEGVGPPEVARCVEVPDLGGDIALETADPRHQAGQGDQERPLERHQEVADHQEAGAQGDGAGAPEHPVGQPAADERGQVDAAGIETEGERSLGGDRETAAEHRLQPMTIGGEARDVLHMAGQEQSLAHVEHQERLHPREREPLPGFGEG